MRVAIVLAALAACTYPEKEFSAPFGCFGDPAPTSAEPVVTIAGNTVDPFEATEDMKPVPIGGVTVELQSDMMIGILPSDRSRDNDGAFELAFTTGGSVFNNLYLNATAAGRVPTYLRPPRPITEDVVLPYTVTSLEQRAVLAMMAFGTPTFPTPTGAVLMRVLDCNSQPIAGATVAANAGVVYYFKGFFPDPAALETDTLGVVMVAMLPPAPVTLTASFDGRTFPSVVVTAVDDAFIQTDLMP